MSRLAFLVTCLCVVSMSTSWADAEALARIRALMEKNAPNVDMATGVSYDAATERVESCTAPDSEGRKVVKITSMATGESRLVVAANNNNSGAPLVC